MPLVTSKRVWTRQPQTRQQLNPLFSDRLIALVVPGQPEYFGGGLPVISGVGKIVPARAGIAAKAVYNGAGANEVRWPVNLSFSGDYTFSVFSSNEDQTTNLITFYTSGTSSNDIKHGNTSSSAYVDNNNSPTIATTVSYAPRLISARRRSNQCSIVVDKTASSENATGTRVQVWTALNVGRNGALNSVGTTNYLIAVWNRYVRDEDLFALSENPWRLLKKKDRRILIPSAGGGSSTDLTIQDSTHSLLSDNLDLSTSLLLTIQDSTHNLTSDSLILNTTGSTDLIIQGATHSLTSDNLLITTEWLLDIASAAHALTSDNLDLSTALSIIIQNAIHSHTADNLVLDTSDTTLLTIQDAVHTHTADNLDLTLDTWLVIANAVHSHLADNIDLGTELTLTIQDSTHTLTSDIIILSIPSTGSCPTVEEIVAAIMIQIEAKNYLTLPQFLSFK